jgi:hypothetical protein
MVYGTRLRWKRCHLCGSDLYGSRPCPCQWQPEPQPDDDDEE